MPRIAAIDWGLKRIGLAISDEMRQIAFPLDFVLAGTNMRQSAKNVLKALSKYILEIDQIIIGLPLLLNGKRGDMAISAEKFADALKNECQISIEMVDERLSTAGADRELKELSYSRKERSQLIDSTSAVMLLQTYLVRCTNSKRNPL